MWRALDFACHIAFLLRRPESNWCPKVMSLVSYLYSTPLYYILKLHKVMYVHHITLEVIRTIVLLELPLLYSAIFCFETNSLIPVKTSPNTIKYKDFMKQIITHNYTKNNHQITSFFLTCLVNL